jgi:hypothetical protein
MLKLSLLITPLLVYCALLMAIYASPVSHVSEPRKAKEVDNSHPLSIFTPGLGKQVKASKRKRPPLPRNLDLRTMSLKDLVDIRPTVKDPKKEQKLYKEYFINHPDVRNINLQDENLGKVTEALYELGQSNQDRIWKQRLAASIQDHIKAAPLDPLRRQALISALKGHRHRTSNMMSQRRWRKKAGVEEIKKRTRAFQEAHENKLGFKYDKKKQRMEQGDFFLNLPLKYHLGMDLTPLQAEAKVRDLLPFYSSEYTLTKKLEEYLKERNVSEGDSIATMAIRENTVRQKSIDARKMKGKGGINSTASRTSLPSQGTSGVYNHPLTSKVVPDDYSPVPPQHLETAHFDPENAADWHWVESILKL